MIRSRWPHSCLPALHLLGFFAIAVAQPLLQLLGRSPEFFVAHRASAADLVLATFLLVLAVPAVLALVVWAAGLLGRKPQQAVTAVLVAVLAAVLAMQGLKQAGAHAWPVAVSAAAVIGAAFALAYARWASVRSFATILSVSAVVVPVVFLTRPGIRRILAAPHAANHAEVRLKPGAPSPGPVVLLVLDETPLLSLLDAEGKIDPVLYPNLAGLARDGVWFRYATSVSDDTRWAVPAILSGLYPRPGLAPTQGDYPKTLFTLLLKTHHLEVMESGTHLCQSEACQEREPLASRLRSLADDLRILYLHILLTGDLRANLPELTKDWARWGVRGAVVRRHRRAADRAAGTRKLDLVRAFRDLISPDDPQPTFYYLHSLLSHSPWEWLPTGQKNATRTPVPSDLPNSSAEAWGVAQYHQRHLMQSELIDRAVGEFVGRLKQAGLYDRTLIVVTADHGVAFRAGYPRRDMYAETAAEIARVPLVIKFPASGPRVPGTVVVGGEVVSDRNAETVDIAPTILEALGLEVSWTIDGASLCRPLDQERPRKTVVVAEAINRVSYGPREPDLQQALEHKVALFGSGGNPYRVPTPPRFAGLVGRAVAECQVTDSRERVAIDSLGQFLEFRPTDVSSPFDVPGRLAGPAGREPRFVAVAVNGTIRAVTRTWHSQPDRFLATPPADAWRIGANRLEVFLVRGDEQRPQLQRLVVEPGRGH